MTPQRYFGDPPKTEACLLCEILEELVKIRELLEKIEKKVERLEEVTG